MSVFSSGSWAKTQSAEQTNRPRVVRSGSGATFLFSTLSNSPMNPPKRHSFFEWTTGVQALLTFTCSLEGLWTTGVHALLWVLIFKVVYLSLSPTTSCFLWVLRPRIFPSFFVRCRVEVPTFWVSFCFCSVSRASIVMSVSSIKIQQINRYQMHRSTGIMVSMNTRKIINWKLKRDINF